MKRKGLLIGLGLMLVLMATCREDDGDYCDSDDTDRPFGVCCNEDSECQDGVCHQFGDGSQACTPECENDDDCPEGSQGKKCNKQGVCRI